MGAAMNHGTVRVLAYQGTSFLSRLIRRFGRYRYSHVALEHTTDGAIVDAWKGGVRLIHDAHDGHDLDTKIDVYIVPEIGEEQASAVFDAAESQVGKPYDYMGVLRFVTRRKHGTDARWFCSELVAWAFEQARYPLLLTPHWNVQPGQLVTSPRLKYFGQYSRRGAGKRGDLRGARTRRDLR